MKKIFKYQIEDELKNLCPIDTTQFHDYINRITVKANKLIRVQENNKFVYFCTHCQTWHSDEKVKLKQFKTCSKCHRKFEVIGKRNIIADNKDFVTIVEKNERKELIIRIFYFEKIYSKSKMDYEIKCFEVERCNADRQVYVFSGIYSNMGLIYFRDGNNVFKKSSYKDRWDNYVYSDNVITTGLKKIIKDTQFKYSCLDKVAKNHIHITDYLKLYLLNPKIELFVKNGNFNIVGYCAKHNHIPISLTCKSNLKYLKHDLSYDEFNTAVKFDLYNYEDIRNYSECKMSDELNFIKEYNLQNKLRRISKYLHNQKEDIHYYRDYLTNAHSIGLSIDDKNVLYPRNLKTSHDEVLAKYNAKKNKFENKEIVEYAKVLDEFSYNYKNLMIRPVHDQIELINESAELHHCVRSYAEKVAKRKTSIFVIRVKNKPDIPYVTLELTGTKVIQCRANHNQKPNESVINFVNVWCDKFKFKSCFS